MHFVGIGDRIKFSVLKIPTRPCSWMWIWMRIRILNFIWCASGCGSGFLFDADVDPDLNPVYQNDAKPCGSGFTPLPQTWKNYKVANFEGMPVGNWPPSLESTEENEGLKIFCQFFCPKIKKEVDQFFLSGTVMKADPNSETGDWGHFLLFKLVQLFYL